MASKKIGAYITLDGEKEFRQNVTNCNKSLTALKSEMSLVKAESEGQANSLETLRKKHDVLQRTLEMQQEKEEEVRKGLNHAKESYDKVGRALEEYRGKLQTAETEMEQMQQGSSATEEELEQQRKTVEKLSLAIEKGEQTYNKAGNRIKDWETKLNTAQAQTVKASRAVNENAAYLKEAEQSADGCAKSIDGFGKRTQEATKVTRDFSTVLKENLYDTMADLGKSGAQEVVKALTSMENAQKQLQASTGLTTAEMKEYKTVMDELYKSNYGDDISDVADSMSLVKQYTNEINPSKVKELTENGIAMRDVFGMDLSETIRGVDTLIDQMGVDAQTAFDLMAAGAQNGLNKSGELADNIAEYGPLWQQAGFSAQEMFVIMQNGLDAGAYNLDKVNDFVKEFGNSLADGRIEKNIDSFSAETQELFSAWKSGKATTKDVFYSVINDLNTATNKQQLLTIASNTWSALGEDNALKVITSLNKTNTAYENVHDTMEKVKDVKYDTLESRLQQLGKTAMTDLVEPIAENALPVIEKGLDAVIDNTDTLITLTKAAAAGAMTYKAAGIAMTAYKTAVELATTKQGVLNVVMNANPAILLATAVAGLGVALSVTAKQSEDIAAEIDGLTESSEKLTTEVTELSQQMQEVKKDWDNTTTSMEAQRATADKLVGELFALEEQTGKTAGEKQRMKVIAGELNALFPELAIAIDEETGALNKSREAVEKSIEASMAYSKAKAAEEKLTEISEKLVDAELKKYEAEQKNLEIGEKLNEVQKEMNEIQSDSTTMREEHNAVMQGSTTRLMELQEEENRLKEKQEESKESIKGLEEEYANLEGTYESVEGYMQEQIGKSEEVAQAYGNAGEAATQSAEAQQEAAEITAQKIAETYNGIQQTVSEVLTSQMSMFEEFNAGTEISTEQLLSNMQSQIDGVTNWADNMAELADRGINQNMLAYLAELGPEGSAYVAAFASMSDAELQKASDMWEQSMDMKEGVSQSVQGMLESYTAALNGGKESVVQATAAIGDGTVQGLVNAINARQQEVVTAGENLGGKTTDAVATGAGTHSPSTKTTETGKNVVQGLVVGMKQTEDIAISGARNLGIKVTKRIDTDLQKSKFVKAGRGVGEGLRSGIKAGESAVLSAISSITTGIKARVTLNIKTEDFQSAGKRIPTGLISGINGGKQTALSAAASLASGVTANASKVGSLYSTGLNMSLGMARGIRAGKSEVINATASVCAAAVSKAKSDLKINSPSKVFEKIGFGMAEGQGLGYRKGTRELNAMIANSVKLPTMEAARAGTDLRTRKVDISGEQQLKDFKQIMKEAVKTAIKEAQVHLEIDGRRLDRTLKGRGVVFA